MLPEKNLNHIYRTIFHKDYSSCSLFKMFSCKSSDPLIISSKEVMFLVALVCFMVCLSILSVYLFVSNITQKSYEQIAMNFYGEVWHKWLYFSGDPDHHADCQIRNSAITQQLWMDVDEIGRGALQWYKEKVIIIFLGWSRSSSWLSNTPIPLQ